MLHPVKRSLGGGVVVAILHPGEAKLAEIILGRLVPGGLERRELAFAEVEALVMLLDPFGDSRRVGQCLGVAGHRPVHLGGGSDVELVAFELHPLRVVDRPPGRDAKEDVVDLGVFLGQVVGVAGGDHREAEAAGEVGGHPFMIALNLDVVVLDLDEEVFRAEDLLIPDSQFLGVGELAVEDVVGEFRRDAARQADQPLGVALENLLVDPSLVVIPFEKRHGREPEQVPEPLAILGEQGQVKVRLLARVSAERLARPMKRGDVGFHADDRLEIVRLGLTKKLDSAVEVAVIGHRQRWHPERLGPFNQRVDFAGSVEHAVMAVTMQVNKRLARHATPRQSSGGKGQTRRSPSLLEVVRSSRSKSSKPSVPQSVSFGFEAPSSRRRNCASA